MAIAETGAIYKSFTFDGIDSRDYGVYISGDGVFDAPERDVEMIEIPGRNGAYALDRGRFKNIEVTYPAGMFGDTEADFRQGISALRNALASRKGYCRLEDEYNPDEYRMAVYRSGLEVTPAQLKAGEFEITFECMPQRFLKSGETAVEVENGGTIINPTLFESHTLLHAWGYGDIGINGSIISINNDEYGKILLANKVSAQQAQAVTYLDKSAQSMLNVGDSFDMDSGANVTVRLDSNLVPAINITNVTVTKTSTDDLAGMSISTSRFSDYAIITFSLPQVGFIYNTTTQVIKSIVNVVINYTQSGTAKSSTFTLEIRGQHVYRSGDSHQVVVSATKSTSNDFSSQFAISTMPIYGMSTKRPFADDADFYFDLDIGEAYKIEDGQTVSVNNAVTIPAQLPTLKSGANTITYDDTITRFDVVPRWWEV